MKLKLLVCAVFATILLFSCKKTETEELGHHHHHRHNHEGDSHSHQNKEDGEDVITLSPEVAEKFGIETIEATSSIMGNVVKAAGIIELTTEGNSVVTSPSTGIITFNRDVEEGSCVGRGAQIATVRAEGVSGGDINHVARINLETAREELDRIEKLYADRLVTRSEYNEAKAEYERARAIYSASAESGKILAPISGIIGKLTVRSGQYVAAGEVIGEIYSSERVIVKAYVPIRDYRKISFATDARIVNQTDGHTALVSEVGGRRLGATSQSETKGGYVPVAFTILNNGDFLPGQTVEVFILGTGDREVVNVPLSAISEQQGTYFVYEQLDEDCYRRLPVITGASDGVNIEIVYGLKGGERIVSTGVTGIRLAETSGAVPEGHSHSH